MFRQLQANRDLAVRILSSQNAAAAAAARQTRAADADDLTGPALGITVSE